MAQESTDAHEREHSVEKLVTPKGDILNDKNSEVDYLNHSVYAEALAKKIDHVSTPITIGVFAKWGSGKSFLLKHVRNLLERRQKQDEIEEEALKEKAKHRSFDCYFRTFLLIIFITVIIIASLWAAYPLMFVSSAQTGNTTVSNKDTSYQVSLSNTTSPTINVTTFNNVVEPPVTESPIDWVAFSRYFALSVLLFSLVVACIVVCGNNDWWSSQFFANFRVVLYAAFTKLPIESPENSIVKESNEDDFKMKMDVEKNKAKTSKTKRRYIFVNFNAWEYAGSDTLWAGIVTNLSNAIEEEFGTVAVRLFRMLELDTLPRDVIPGDVNTTNTMLFINFPICSKNAQKVKEIMIEFGVIRFCKKLEDWKNPNLKKKKILDENSFKNWWVVDYSTCHEAHNAYRILHLKGLTVEFTDPRLSLTELEKQPQPLQNSKPQPKNNHNHRASKRYGRNSKDEIELEELTSGENENLSQPDDISSSADDHSCHKSYGPQTFTQHFMKHPKTTCNFPDLYWCILMILTIISLPVITYVIAKSFQLDIFRVGRAVPLAVQILSWMPAVGASSFVMIKFAWAMFHSQRSRIHSALEGAEGNMTAQLGFMNKVKTEVEYMTELIHCAEFSHNTKYKVIISIDDLDRVALEKIKSVLEAVSILLSDNSSPFTCMIAVDSRVAVKSIEETMGWALLRSRVNGHEYLKKIINLPFCIPEIDKRKKKHYIEGLIDLSDKAVKQKKPRDNSENQNSLPETRSAARLTGSPENLAISSNASDSDNDDSTPAVSARNISPFDVNEEVRKSQKQSKRTPDDDIDGTFRKTDKADVMDSSKSGGRKIRGSVVSDHSSPVEERKPTPRQKRKLHLKASQNHNSSEVLTTIDESEPSSKTRDDDSSSSTKTQTAQPQEDGSLRSTASTEAPLGQLQEEILSNTEFLYECRIYLYKSDVVQRHLEGNPRNIKRIFNVISLTSWILHCYEEQQLRADFFKENSELKKRSSSSCCSAGDESTNESLRITNVKKTKHFAHDLVLWVILTDQWPYRMSYLLQVIEDADHKANAGKKDFSMDEDASLLDIYERFVLPELNAIRSNDEDTTLLSLDVHPNMLNSFLVELNRGHHFIDRKKIKLLNQVTINLDQSLRQTIVCHREVALDILNENVNSNKTSSKKKRDEKMQKLEIKKWMQIRKLEMEKICKGRKQSWSR